jgi:hypothetical protein
MRARIRRLIINPNAFCSIMQTDSMWRCHEGIPKDAELVGSTQDPQTMNFILFIASKEFEQIDPQEDVAPLLVLEIRKVL